jgi:hypothetical protein
MTKRRSKKKTPKQTRHFNTYIQSELYDPYLSSEIVSYIDPIVHKLMIFCGSIENQKISDAIITRLSVHALPEAIASGEVNRPHEDDLKEMLDNYGLNLYMILKFVCFDVTPSELEYFFELFRSNIDINNIELEDLERYILTPEKYEIIIHEGRDLSQRVVDGNVYYDNPFLFYSSKSNWPVVMVILKNTDAYDLPMDALEFLVYNYIVGENCLAPIIYLARYGNLADVDMDVVMEGLEDLDRAQQKRYNIVSKLLLE